MLYYFWDSYSRISFSSLSIFASSSLSSSPTFEASFSLIAISKSGTPSVNQCVTYLASFLSSSILFSDSRSGTKGVTVTSFLNLKYWTKYWPYLSMDFEINSLMKLSSAERVFWTFEPSASVTEYVTDWLMKGTLNIAKLRRPDLTSQSLLAEINAWIRLVAPARASSESGVFLTA